MRIALIHALTESVAPVHAAFARHWPAATCFDLLDNSLSADLADAGMLTPALHARFLTLGHYAAEQQGKGGKTTAILFTCSAFGPAIEAVKQAVALPVLKPNESAFASALAAGSRIALLVTFPPSLESLRVELQQMAAGAGRQVTIEARIVDGALAALKAGDATSHDRLIAAAAEALPPVDAVILGQFSMARAAAIMPPRSDRQIITTPDAAVLALRQMLTGTGA